MSCAAHLTFMSRTNHPPPTPHQQFALRRCHPAGLKRILFTYMAGKVSEEENIYFLIPRLASDPLLNTVSTPPHTHIHTRPPGFTLRVMRGRFFIQAAHVIIYGQAEILINHVVVSTGIKFHCLIYCRVKMFSGLRTDFWGDRLCQSGMLLMIILSVAYLVLKRVLELILNICFAITYLYKKYCSVFLSCQLFRKKLEELRILTLSWRWYFKSWPSGLWLHVTFGRSMLPPSSEWSNVIILPQHYTGSQPRRTFDSIMGALNVLSHHGTTTTFFRKALTVLRGIWANPNDLLDLHIETFW